MSNYIKATDFATKDSLITGDPLKIVSGTEINDEYNAIQTAVNSKADLNSPTLTGVPRAPTASSGTSTTQIATTAFVENADDNLESSLTTAFRALYPVGTIYINATDDTNPGTLLGFGTWVAFGAGRVPVGFNASDPLFDTAEETGGSKNSIVVDHNHTGTTDTASLTGQIKAGPVRHDAQVSASGIVSFSRYSGSSNGTSGTLNGSIFDFDASHSHSLSINSEGESGTNKNLQPYITVHMWKRVS